MGLVSVSLKRGVPPLLADGMWFAETQRGTHPETFIHRAKVTDYGHYQVTRPTRGDMLKAGCKDPWSRNIETATDGPAHYLNSLKNRYHGDWMKAVAAYNWGMKRIDDAVAAYGDDWYAHCREITIKHVRKVMSASEGLEIFEEGLRIDNQALARELGFKPEELRKTAYSMMRGGLIRGPRIELDTVGLLTMDDVSTSEPSLSGVSSALPWQGSQSANPQTASPGELLPPPPMIRQAAPAAWPTIQATEPPMTRLAPERTAPIIEPLAAPAERAPAPGRLVPIIQHVPAPVRSNMAQPAAAAAPIIQTLEPPIKRTPALTEHAEPIVVRPTAPALAERAKTPIQHQPAPIEPSPPPSKTPSAPPDPRHYVRPRTLTI